jgi:hypothetical protein
MDWLQRTLFSKNPNQSISNGRIAYVSNNGDGPFGNCEWKPPIGPDEAYF